MLGAGVEHRWQRFALQAELRGVSISGDDEMTVVVDGNGTTTTASSGELGGGQLTLGGAFYF